MVSCVDCGDQVRGLVEEYVRLGRLQLPRCYPCYLDSDDVIHRYERVPGVGRYSDETRWLDAVNDKIRYLVAFPLDGAGRGPLVGCKNADDADAVSRAVTTSDIEEWFPTAERYDLAVKYGEEGFEPAWCFRLSAWQLGNILSPGRDELMGVVELGGRVCSLNANSYVEAADRDRIVSTLADRFVEEADFRGVETLGDVGGVLGQTYPVGSTFFPRLEYDVRERVKEMDGILGERSRRTIENNERGEAFERLFSTLCEEVELNTQRSRGVHAVPEPVRKDVDDLGSRSGLPDFFVWGREDRLVAFVDGLLADGSFDSIGQAGVFVEVKYTSWDPRRPHVTESQRQRIPELLNRGYDVFFFKGTPEEYWLEVASV